MRRGHQGIGGWRNENPRQFRPRNGGNSHFRPVRNFNQSNSNNRFPPSGPRSHKTHFNSRSTNDNFEDQEHYDRNRYRQESRSRPVSFPRSKDKTSFQGDTHIPVIQQLKYGDNSTSYKVGSSSNIYSINSMGDIDHRPVNKVHPIPPWNIDNHFHDIDDRVYKSLYREDITEVNKSHLNYAGHRPPASDHYGGNPVPTNEKSNMFSRSIDDTVNIVRKRLLSRGEGQQVQDSEDNTNNVIEETINTVVAPSGNQNEQISKKKIPKPSKANWNKLKNKIFHELFKMDKKKIQKLLDNPNSSTKFEYAMNSLLTESQISFNQHLRSVAEKSLCSSSVESMQYENNTIYEDTFMKQMQCILDPQDTVLLEDIKPVVMAELNNLFQLNDIDSKFQDNQQNFLYNQESKDFEQYSSNDTREQPTHSNYDLPNNLESYDTYFDTLSPGFLSFEDYKMNINNQGSSYKNVTPIFKRREQRRSNTLISDIDIERRNLRKSLDNKIVDSYSQDEQFVQSKQIQPVFDASAEFIDDEDTFAELDKQYHVAVDHDFIENDDLSNPIEDSNNIQVEKTINISQSPVKSKQDLHFLKTPIKVEQLVKQEIDSQLQDMASVEINSFMIKNESEKKNGNEQICTQNSLCSTNKSETCQQNLCNGIEIKNKSQTSDNILNSTEPKISPLINSRKRSIEQNPSHRKEKRKKSQDTVDSINLSIKNNRPDDLSNKEQKKGNELKQTKEKRHLKDKHISCCNRIYSDKDVKRKEAPKKIKENENRKRQNSTSSINSISPKNSLTNQSSTKPDPKSSLKTIDMFTEVPKKNNIHQAFRNTALSISPKKVAEIKPVSSFKIKSQNKHDVGTRVIKRFISKETQTLDSKSSTSRFCQTDRHRLATTAVQTDTQPDKHKELKSTDVFERMKEIDLEIQVLLQEKFKLYSSLETKEGTIPMHNLGMTVLNVTSFDENQEKCENEDFENTIADNFTNIPEDELAQIAFDSVDTQSSCPLRSNRIRRRKNSYASINSVSTTSSTTKNKKNKTPNISLIEQIITDDRPLEDIISLDDLETTPIKSKKKQKGKIQSKKKSVSKKRNKTVHATDHIALKECYVYLSRDDLSEYLATYKERNTDENTNESNIIHFTVEEECEISANRTEEMLDLSQCEDVIEETEVSPIQFDMLDVSEDIVIGEHYEEKSTGEKEAMEHLEVSMSEEIILDNKETVEDVTTPAEAQGGECKLYDYLSDENLQRDSLVVNGNADAILAIECVGPNFLAAGLDGNVYYFSSDGQLINTLRGSNLAVTCLCIVKEKYGTTVYAGSLDSRIRNYDLETGLEKGPECNVLSPIQTMDRAWDTVFVGTRTGFVLQFECKNNLLIPVSTVKFSDQSILALRAMKEGPRKVLLVAARSENVTIKDAQTGLLLRTLNGPKMTVYTLLYDEGKVYCGTSSHHIQVFEYTSGSHVGTHEGGKGAVCLRTAGGLLFAGCYDGCVYVYREGEPRPFAQLRGPSLMLLCLAIVGTKIIAGFKDRSLYIWKIPLCILQEMIL